MTFDYYEGLDDVSRTRYNEKLQLIGAKECPYKWPAGVWKRNPRRWPSIEFGDIFNYLIETPDVFTFKALKNREGLEAHKWFVAGCVSRIVCHQPEGSQHVILRATVKPPQDLDEDGYVKPPHNTDEDGYTPWVAALWVGTIVAANCNCTLGLEISCSHIAALLFKLEACVRLGFMKTPSSDKPCLDQQFLDFSKKHKVQPARVSEIQFYSDEQLARAKSRPQRKRKEIQPPTSAEHKAFLDKLFAVSPTSAIFSCMEEYAEGHRAALKKDSDKPIVPLTQSNKSLNGISRQIQGKQRQSAAECDRQLARARSGPQRKQKEIRPPTPAEQKAFLDKLFAVSPTSAIFSCMEEYAEGHRAAIKKSRSRNKPCH